MQRCMQQNAYSPEELEENIREAYQLMTEEKVVCPMFGSRLRTSEWWCEAYLFFNSNLKKITFKSVFYSYREKANQVWEGLKNYKVPSSHRLFPNIQLINHQDGV